MAVQEKEVWSFFSLLLLLLLLLPNNESILAVRRRRITSGSTGHNQFRKPLFKKIPFSIFRVFSSFSLPCTAVVVVVTEDLKPLFHKTTVVKIDAFIFPG